MFLLLLSREEFEKRDLDFLETRNAKLSRSREIETSRRDEDGLETKIGTLRAWSMLVRNICTQLSTLQKVGWASLFGQQVSSPPSLEPKEKRFFRTPSYEYEDHRSNCSKIVMLLARVHAFDVEPYLRMIELLVLLRPRVSGLCSSCWIDRMLLHRPRCNITGPLVPRSFLSLWRCHEMMLTLRCSGDLIGSNPASALSLPRVAATYIRLLYFLINYLIT